MRVKLDQSMQTVVVVVVYRGAAALGGTKMTEETPPHTCMTDTNRNTRKRSNWLLYGSEHVSVNVYSTTPSCPLPSVWASAIT